nr:phytoene/squalene synthase family protein [Nocardia bovistercoris]
MRVAAEHGRTYYLATRLLSPDRRRAVHALYAFARSVDDIVDNAESVSAQAQSAAHAAHRLDLVEHHLRTMIAEGAAPTASADAPIAPHILFAVADTIRRYDIDTAHFLTFLDSMRMDIPDTPGFRARYATMTDLREYMRGSAAAIGLQLLPVLGTTVTIEEAEPAAAALGEAFQLTNFLRDTAEDLDRGRIYLPTEDLAAFGVDEPMLTHCHRTRKTTKELRRALTHLIAVNRDLYRRAAPGTALLHPTVRPAIRTASTLYAEILTRIEKIDYEIFHTRATVPHTHRVGKALTELAKTPFQH